MESRHEQVPFGGFFDDMFRGGHGLVWKMLAGAGVTVLLVIGSFAKMADDEKIELPESWTTRGLIVAVVALVGALAGAGLVVKDVVEDRDLAGKTVAWPLRLMFAKGWVSLALWIPVAIFGTLAATLLTLGF